MLFRDKENSHTLGLYSLLKGKRQLPQNSATLRKVTKGT